MLTPYQRGGRDSLRAFADEMDHDHTADSEHVRRRVKAMQLVARLRRGGLSIEDARTLSAAFTYPLTAAELARLARFRSEALPDDPGSAITHRFASDGL